MRVYTVHQGRDDTPEHTVFVKDGFCWPALFVPLFWFVYRRLWLGLLLWLVGSVVLGAVLELGGVSDGVALAALFAFHLLVGFEANNIWRWTLARHGRPHVASVVAPNLDAAEMRYFQLRSAQTSRAAPPPFPDRPASPPISRALTESPVLGLYPYPERRP